MVFKGSLFFFPNSQSFTDVSLMSVFTFLHLWLVWMLLKNLKLCVYRSRIKAAKMCPTHHHSGQLRPRRIQRRMRVLAHTRCAPPTVWWRHRSLSSTGPQLHCDWLWALQPPQSGHDSGWFCVPNRGRILMCERCCGTWISYFTLEDKFLFTPFSPFQT